MSAQEAWRLNDRGRCCGRKPLTYKRPSLHFFCSRCARHYNPAGEQIPCFLWLQSAGNTFTPRYPEQDYALMERRP